jgi:hypothetical protein
VSSRAGWRSLDQLSLSAALSVGLEDVKDLMLYLGLPPKSLLFDVLDGIDDDQLAEEFGVGVDELAAHGGLSVVQQAASTSLSTLTANFSSM